MLNLWNLSSRADLLDRRELLRVGGLSLAGLSLPQLLNAQGRPAPQPRQRRPRSFGQAKHCIILYLSGGPAQLDTFDPKPDAAEDIRGEFSTINTSVAGVRFSELVPHTARWMNKVGLVRTMNHTHTIMAGARTGCSRATCIRAACRT